MTWSCEQKNQSFEEKGAPEHLFDDCTNYAQLLRKYGPNYEALKPKMGHVRGLFEEE